MTMPLPTLDQRLAVRAAGVSPVVMRQRWSELLFLHWRWEVADLQRRLPPGLWVDTFDGEAWLGVVPFFMDRIRPRFLPPVPGLSWFRELNVRTYVHDDQGRPGVWFFSLDCDQAVAVRVARALFRLPYFDAAMAAQREAGKVRFDCRRKAETGSSRFVYELGEALPTPEAGSLAFWLVERYALFANTRAGLQLGRVAHEPYPLTAVTLREWDALPLSWDGFEMPQRAPDHVAGSRGVEVRVGPLERL
jgi:uncharacterized protein YqjF (DUF2071 family)